MNSKIIKQMWVQRRQNGWIFIEMIIISFFLWKAMDSIYTLTALSNFNKGYTPDNTFSIQLDVENKDRELAFSRVLDALKINPMVQDVAITGYFTYPGALSKASYSFKSEKNPEWSMSIVYDIYSNHAQNYMNIVGYKDIRTGMPPLIDKNISKENICYITKVAAAKYFPDGSNPVGQNISTPRTVLTVAGVIEDVITSFGTYEPLVIVFDSFSKISKSSYDNAEILLKLKENANPEKFSKSFMKDIAPNLSSESCKITGIRSLDQIYLQGRATLGVDGQSRLQNILSFFFIACAFLGIAGTIWMKCNRRCSEIGLYRAMGCTKNGILGMFYTEAVILITLAFAASLIPLAAIILNNNEFLFKSPFFDMTINNSSPYALYQFLPHFGIVTLITYAILMGTAFIGTYITVHKYSNLQPSEALRDE